MRKIIPIFVPHQGCPQRCIFCHQPHITGVALHTAVTPQDIHNTIETALREPKSQQRGARFEAAFYGGSFTGLPVDTQEQFLKVAQCYVQRGDLTGIRLSTHPKMFDEQIFDLLNQYPVTTIELGVQSFDNRVLRQARRGHQAEDVEVVIRTLQKLGIAAGIHLMVGLPGDSHEICLRSVEKTIKLRPESVRIHPTLVLRNTPLEQLYVQKQYQPWTLEAAVTTCKAMLKRLQVHHIPVIRIGLQPTESMVCNIVVGPYHPAIRQLVDSELMYDQMAQLCAAHHALHHEVTFQVAPQDISTIRGQKNRNIRRLRDRFRFTAVHILADETLQRGEIRLL